MEVTSLANKIELVNERLMFYIDCGTTFSFESVYKDQAGDPIDVSGYSARLSFKDRVGGTEHFRLTESDGISVGTTDGKFTATISDVRTALLQSGGYGKKGVCAMEVESPGGVVVRLFDGLWVSSPEVVD